MLKSRGYDFARLRSECLYHLVRRGSQYQRRCDPNSRAAERNARREEKSNGDWSAVQRV